MNMADNIWYACDQCNGLYKELTEYTEHKVSCSGHVEEGHSFIVCRTAVLFTLLGVFFKHKSSNSQDLSEAVLHEITLKAYQLGVMEKQCSKQQSNTDDVHDGNIQSIPKESKSELSCTSTVGLSHEAKDLQVSGVAEFSNNNEATVSVTLESLQNHVPVLQEDGQVATSASATCPTVLNCTYCGYQTRHKGMYRRHMDIHAGGGEFMCEVCGHRSLYRREHKRHMQIHNGFSCDICGKQYTRRHDRDQHYAIKHKGAEKKFKCSQCPFVAHYQHLLVEHTRKHTGQKYVCPINDCPYQTIYKRALQTHLNTMHVDYKKYSCEKCSFRTNEKGQFGRHMKMHDPIKRHQYKCEVCDYTAPEMSYIRSHMVKHDTQRQYQCNQCSFSTNHSSSLRVHLMGHVGIRPWICSVCPYKSVTKQKVDRHISNKHDSKGSAVKDDVNFVFDPEVYKT